jgi:predicted dehydrogenase
MLRFGVVGTGYWATRVHLPASIASDRVELVGIVGRDATRTKALADEWSVKSFGTAAELIAEVDVVGFAVPPQTQADLALEAARADKHLLLEKPVSTSITAARRLGAEVRKRNLATVVFASALFMAPTATWFDSMRAAGPWRFARIESISATMRDATNPFHGSAWRQKVGALWDTGPHGISTLCSVLGEVESVFATRGPGDMTALTLVHRSGAISSLVLCSDASTSGTLASSIFVGDSGVSSPPAISDWEAASRSAYVTALASIADQVEHGTVSSTSDLRFGLHVVEILDGAEKSLRSGVPTHLS